MPYKCVHCSAVYADGSKDVLVGCTKCRSKFFFYIKEEKLKEMEQTATLELTAQEKKQMEVDVREIAGLEEPDTPVFLDFESVRVLKPGKYLIDIAKLFSRDKPRVYQIEDGKYIVDLVSVRKNEES